MGSKTAQYAPKKRERERERENWDIYQNIFFCVPQKEPSQTGLDGHEGDRIFILGELSLQDRLSQCQKVKPIK